MRSAIKATCVAITIAGASMASSIPAQAHPHVWVTSVSELIFDAKGSLTGIRQRWTFDDMFSAYALQGLSTKTKGIYTRDDLAPLAQTNVESLKEYGYFTFVRIDGRKQKLRDPVDYFLEYQKGALVLNFVLPLQTPVPAKALQVEIFDPSYFVDFALAKETPVTLSNAPQGCGFDVARPADGAPRAQTLDENSFLSGENRNYGAMFANKIAVTCP